MTTNPSCPRPVPPRRALARWSLPLVLVALAACSAPGQDPPVAALTGDPDQAMERPVPAGGERTTAATDADPDGGPAGAAGSIGAAGLDVCDLARDAEVMADVERWGAYVPAMQAVLPAEVDVAGTFASLTPDTAVTPTLMTRLDRVWDLVDAHCQQDPLVEQCRSLIAIAMADPVGWAVRAGDPAEVEAAFALAVDNWTDLRQRAVGDDLRRAVDAHLRFLADAIPLLAEAGWAAGRVDVLEPLADQLVALAEPDLLDPVYALEVECGFH